MKTKVLTKYLNKRFPKHLTPVHDFLGTTYGLKLPLNIDKVLIALDATLATITYAIENNIKLIITHHPFIYGTVSDALKYSIELKNKYDLLKSNNIAVFAMHTNFDIAKDGMNYQLLKKLHCENIKQFGNSFMFIGEKEEEDINQLASELIGTFNLNYALVYQNNEKKIRNIGVIGGSGMSELKSVIDSNVDVFITGELKHHHRETLKYYKLNVIEVDHLIEKIFIENIANDLRNNFKELEVLTIDDQVIPKPII